MVDFDAAVAAVQDPNADPVFLAKIRLRKSGIRRECGCQIRVRTQA